MDDDLRFSTTVYDVVVLPAPHNKKIRTKRVRDYYACREMLAGHFKDAWKRNEKKWKDLPVSYKCDLKCIVARKTRREADFDNLVKTVADSLCDAGIITNDSLIYDGRLIKRVGHHRDYVVISIYKHDPKRSK